MYQDKKILGIITARGGSKGIPGKNIKPLLGKPLIAYTIQAAADSKLLTRFIVSTDDSEIADISRQYGADVPFMRPRELAQDHSKSIQVVQHALEYLNRDANEEYDYVMILQPTSPLRIGEDIDNCIKLIVESGADSVMSMVEIPDFAIRKLKKIENQTIFPLIEDEGRESTRRQDQEKVYKRNCAIYLTRANLLKQGDLFGNRSLPYIMPGHRSVDINDPVDFELAEFWLKKKNI